MFDDEIRICAKCGGPRRNYEFCPNCKQKFEEYRGAPSSIALNSSKKAKEMAFSKKPDPVPPDPNEIVKLKQQIADGANDVAKAFAGMPASIPLNVDNDRSWLDAQQAVSRLDREFSDVEMRVLQVGPDGRLTDVSDKVNPRDIRPEQIEGFQSSDGSVRLPRNPNGEVDREATLDIMAQLVGISRNIRRPREEANVSTAATREMESLLAESTKLLSKLRR